MESEKFAASELLVNEKNIDLERVKADLQKDDPDTSVIDKLIEENKRAKHSADGELHRTGNLEDNRQDSKQHSPEV